MIIKLKIFTIILSIVFFTYSCDKVEYNIKRNTKILTANDWILDSYIDHSVNQEIEVYNYIYSFNSDGTFSKTMLNEDTLLLNWEFLHDCENIKLGSDIFGVGTLSSSVIRLQYGEIDIFLLPIEE